ncbi:tetratricopeptide repeat protein [Pseudoalteromonas ardens]|uniref:Uncharacterized protein n=1 Tax=Pseudoalteromonas rubra TaxID=43658 RepID=A0A0L0EX63_9GAMM|nr:tetratricopeptide repeat protein [Pseudoalteromonas sp. R96]KNC69032.1 hypothetical protein AC626_01025 [Pseudoalteromonas rubra]MDK1313711.1 tetratricopeptide repeat protein [Pseudoalteromonas sp. R96]
MFSGNTDNRVGVKSASITAKAAIAAAIITTVGGIIVAIMSGGSGSTDVNINGEVNTVHTGSGDIVQHHHGISFEKYEAGLKHREKEVTDRLSRAHDKDKAILERQLLELQVKIADIETAYQQHISQLQSSIERLESFRSTVTSELFDKAKQALIEGDSVKADRLLAQFEQSEQETLNSLAEASYQRGIIAREDIRYRDAYEHFHKAVRLSFENALYNNQAGLLAQTLGDYDKAIGYYEQALKSDLKAFGEDHPDVATRRNNLGSAWETKGDYNKAIGYYELALKSVLKTFGEDHPNVAIGRNNLGSAWEAKGDYDKAIGYYELALKSDLKTFDEDHPTVANRRNNLGSAWTAKGDYDKAIAYFEQALAGLQTSLGDNHPYTQTVKRNLNHAKAIRLASKSTSNDSM